MMARFPIEAVTNVIKGNCDIEFLMPGEKADLTRGGILLQGALSTQTTPTTLLPTPPKTGV